MQNKTEHKCINGDKSSPRNRKTFQNYQDKVFLKIFLYNDLQLLDLLPPTCIAHVRLTRKPPVPIPADLILLTTSGHPPVSSLLSTKIQREVKNEFFGTYSLYSIGNCYHFIGFINELTQLNFVI